jgi:hypothetical protein
MTTLHKILTAIETAYYKITKTIYIAYLKSPLVDWAGVLDKRPFGTNGLPTKADYISIIQQDDIPIYDSQIKFSETPFIYETKATPLEIDPSFRPSLLLKINQIYRQYKNSPYLQGDHNQYRIVRNPKEYILLGQFKTTPTIYWALELK